MILSELLVDLTTHYNAIIRSAVKHSLGKYNVAPTIDFNQETSFNIQTMENREGYREPQIKVDTNFNPFEKEKPTEIFSWGDVIENEETNPQQELANNPFGILAHL